MSGPASTAVPPPPVATPPFGGTPAARWVVAGAEAVAVEGSAVEGTAVGATVVGGTVAGAAAVDGAAVEDASPLVDQVAAVEGDGAAPVGPPPPELQAANRAARTVRRPSAPRTAGPDVLRPAGTGEDPFGTSAPSSGGGASRDVTPDRAFAGCPWCHARRASTPCGHHQHPPIAEHGIRAGPRRRTGDPGDAGGFRPR
jgi:hypothetical protein